MVLQTSTNLLIRVGKAGSDISANVVIVKMTATQAIAQGLVSSVRVSRLFDRDLIHFELSPMPNCCIINTKSKDMTKSCLANVLSSERYHTIT